MNVMTTGTGQRTITDEARFLSGLVDGGLLAASDVNRLARTQAETGETLCRLIPKLGLLEEKVLAEQAALFLKLRLFDKEALPSEPLLPEQLSETFLMAEGLLPVQLQDGRLMVATSDPFSDYNRRAIELASKMPVGFVVATQSDIDNALRRLYEPRAEAGGETQADASSDVGYEEDIQRLKDMAAEAPVIRFVNQLFQDAVEKRSSDIHLEPFHTVLARAVSDRRAPARNGRAAPAAHLGDPLTHQAPCAFEYRRAAFAPGWPHPHRHQRQDDGCARLDRADGLRRSRRDAPSRQIGRVL